MPCMLVEILCDESGTKYMGTQLLAVEILGFVTLSR